jgi:NDP-sugar pyrophosphorylase family protein
MKAIILAAGKGTRLGKITESIPKSLVEVAGRSILERSFDCLPDDIDEVIIVVNYLADKIKNNIGKYHKNIPVRYVEQNIFAGTAGALWQAKPYLDDKKFLVLNGDDIYLKSDIKNCLAHDMAMGLSKRKSLGKGYLSIDLDESGIIIGNHLPELEELNSEIIMANGVYVLDKRIFNYDPVQMSNGEFGLPHTILSMAKDYFIRGVVMNFWLPINSKDDIMTAENVLKN